MTTGIGPYHVPLPVDTDPSLTVLETEFVVEHTHVDLGGGLMAHAETINGAIPGPTLRLNVGDTVIVRLINLMDHPTGIHWHGIELANSADGTEVTQREVTGTLSPVPPPPAPAGGSYLYKFTVTRPGLYWYHPHHHMSTNRVFRGQYGMIIVTDPAEVAGVLPGPADTLPLVLSDITVCKMPGMNDAATYVNPTSIPLVADRPEWLSGATAQPAPTPIALCQNAMTGGDARDEHGAPAAASYGMDEVPSLTRTGRTNEGQVVLTNGMNVGARAGTPLAPQAVSPTAVKHPVVRGQGLRLQIVNCATTRYFRLILTTSTGTQVPLVRVGGEGGLLDNPVLEGGMQGMWDTGYLQGEILLPPGTRAEVVATIPAGEPPGSVLTMWTRDFQRTGPGPGNPNSWAMIPTVPVMHLEITPAAPLAYALAPAAVLRTVAVETLTGPFASLLIPATFSKPGMPVVGDPTTQEIRFTTTPLGVNGITGGFEVPPYPNAPHIASSRYAEQGGTLELVLENTSPAHHPFHDHGFSFQPVSLDPGPGAPIGAGSFAWPYREFRDNLDIPGNYRLTFRVRLDPRPLLDDVTPGGALGRWLFHCHIFFHHHQGMISELVVTAADGSEKPDVDVNGSWAYAPIPGIATRTGTFSHPDGDLMTLTASKGTVVPAGPAPGGTWSWSYTATVADLPGTEYVYITGTDPGGRSDQAVFRLKLGAPDDGADNGDPHIHTVDGNRYDFQAVGEFVLLRDPESGLEIQARQTPVVTANPITDPHSGLTVCVSLNTAVAARVGSHSIAFQPAQERGPLQLFVDGKPVRFTERGLDLDGHRVSTFDVNGEAGLRVDYADHTVLTVSPHFWNSHGLWYLNVSVSRTQAEWGIMGSIPADTWLPRLPNGATVGPMPASLNDRYTALYRTFADAWRVTDAGSLFVYAAGTSTATFTDRDWPGDSPPCKPDPRLEIPGAPVLTGMGIEEARSICRGVTLERLNLDCVFDVATTGDETFAKGYLQAQDLRLHGTAVQIAGGRPATRAGEPLDVRATVSPLHGDGPVPAGSVTFVVDGGAAAPAVKLDEAGQARFTVNGLAVGTHRIRAQYAGGEGGHPYHPSGSPNLLHTVREREGGKDGPGDQGTVDVPPAAPRHPWWIWIVLILLLILILIAVM
jgi:FtsP/CotA-like multicopper oxidase with cupredoxin domain